MRIVIAGPGAIGCLFAGLLTEAGNEVWLLDRNPARAAAISRDGLLVEGIGGSRRIPVKAVCEAALIPDSSYLLICVKSYDTTAAVRHAAAAIGRSGHVVSIQNGLGNIEQIQTTVPGKSLIAGITSQGSTTLGPGHIRHAGTGSTYLSPTGRNAAPAEELCGILNGAGLTCATSPDCNSILWGKAVLSAGLNPVSAIWGVPNGEVISRPDLREISGGAIGEAVAVAEALRITLPTPAAFVRFEQLCTLTAANRSSMLQDVTNRKRTEIEAINGYIVKQGLKTGVPVPVNEMLTGRIRALEAGYTGDAS